MTIEILGFKMITAYDTYKSKIEIRHQIIKTILKWNFSEFNAISYRKGPHKIMISVIRLGEIET